MTAAFPLKIRPLRTDIMLGGNQYYEVQEPCGAIGLRLLFTKAELDAARAEAAKAGEQVDEPQVQSVAQPVRAAPQAWARKEADKLMTQNPGELFRSMKIGAGGVIQNSEGRTLLTYERWVWIEEVLRALEAKGAQMSMF